MKLNTKVDLSLNVDKKKVQPLDVELRSYDKDNHEFEISFLKHTLEPTDEVHILTKFNMSGRTDLSPATVEDGKAYFSLNTDLIVESEIATSYVHLKTSDMQVEVDAFKYHVTLSEIDKNAVVTAEAYDKNYETLLQDFEAQLQSYLDGLITDADGTPIDLAGYATEEFVQGLIDDIGIIEGPMGPKGEKGEPGVQGPPGEQGVPGKDGIDGLTGPKGDKGEPGRDGVDGKDGIMTFEDLTPEQIESLRGAKGEPGEDGTSFTFEDLTDEQIEMLRGPKGEQGIQGDPGQAGRDGRSFTFNDLTPEQIGLLTGPQGEKGDIGPEGPQGPKGDPGEPGKDGLDGSLYDDTELREMINEKPSVVFTDEAEFNAITNPDLNTFYVLLKGGN